MDASILVDRLLTDAPLVALLSKGADGQPAIYQIVAPESEVFPRLAIFEDSREYTEFADDEPTEEAVRFRVDIYSRENNLNEVSAALHKALRRLNFSRVNPLPDDFIPDYDIFVKSAIYETHEQLSF